MIKTNKRMISINSIIITVKIVIKILTIMGKKMMIIFKVKNNCIKTANIEKIINMKMFKLKMRRNSNNLMIGFQNKIIILLMMIKEGKHLVLEIISIII